MQLRILFGVTAFASLVSCQNGTVDITYDYSKQIDRDIFHQGVYSTGEGVEEEVGTSIETFGNVTWRTDGKQTIFERRFIVDRSRGYHKNSMPLELTYRMPEVDLVAEDINKVTAVHGNEQFIPKVVENLPVKEMFKRQLRDAKYQLAFDRYDKKRWDVGHVLIGPVPKNSNVTELLKSRGRLPIPAFPIDSVVTKAITSLSDEDCLEYTVYYREHDPFPNFLWEQFAYSTERGKPYQVYKADSTVFSVAYTVFIKPTTGALCQEREVKRGVDYISNPTTKEQFTFISNVSDETLYTRPKKSN